MSPRRALVATFGSAGDLFPFVPVADELTVRGTEVHVAAPRSIGLYLRARGMTTVGLGQGAEMAVVDDPTVGSTRFDGWASVRRVACRYVAPTLPADVRTLESHIAEWRPDVVVAAGFATAARVAAARAGLPVVDLSIYPQHARLAGPASGFARPLVRRAEALRPGAGRAGRGKLVWGAPADVLFHDRALLGSVVVEPEPIGFPVWDDVPGHPRDETALAAWLDAADGRPTVLVTLGSFLGLVQRSFWAGVADAVAALGVRAALVGAGGRWSSPAWEGRSDLLATGFVPLSRHLHKAAAVVHHGGIGTTFATLRAGRPAVVAPQSFDQTFNARLLESCGAGVDARRAGLTEALRTALRPAARHAATEVRARLADPRVAVVAAADRIAAAASVPR